MDVVIKNVPEGAVDSVKNMATIAVERYYRADLNANQPKDLQDAFKASVDGFLEANGLPKKFAIKLVSEGE